MPAARPASRAEVVTHLKKGETVNDLLEQINLDKHKANEPAQWAKIALPIRALTSGLKSSLYRSHQQDGLDQKIEFARRPR